ncbi:MAG: class I SAM-dependent methyltransferase family protein [Nanoarchaeota archaeon]|nr:class I SAM-dependent methyltransferase family protein [Nanoarchaeota archaeon]MBU1631628.1 class I SAM-dependent methyltransferase family protein [Nanoarchaeota archaeon]MBU1876619.1 class I SAM-dependent methyltransferase family protein [Nanoarchaeota archaeon]
MLAAYTELKNAEKVKIYLVKKKILDNHHLPVKEFGKIYFPLIKNIKVQNAEIVNTRFSFPENERPLTIDELLKDTLTKKELGLLPRSQEIVGEIMILEIPESLQDKEKLIAEAYLKTNKNIKTVVKKDEFHSGIYRTRKVRVLAGKRSKETIHHENGVKIKLHLEKTYFSARSGNERLRIAKQVKNKEEILVMFSGAAPYPLVLAKNSSAKMIYGVELNLLAHQYALGNVYLNNLNDKIAIFHGDVRKIIPKIKKNFDRIVMPLPKTGEEFLDIALRKAKKNTIIHLYAFLEEKEINKYALKIKKICTGLKHPVEVLRKVKCGQFSPGTFRVCFDLKVLK